MKNERSSEGKTGSKPRTSNMYLIHWQANIFTFLILRVELLMQTMMDQNLQVHVHFMFIIIFIIIIICLHAFLCWVHNISASCNLVCVSCTPDMPRHPALTTYHPCGKWLS